MDSCHDAKHQLYKALIDYDLDKLRTLFDFGISPNERFNGYYVSDFYEGQDCFDIALTEGDEEMLELLLEYDFDFHKKCRDGPSALHQACALGKLDAVKLLIRYGHTVHCFGKEMGDLPIMKTVACYNTLFPSSSSNYLEIAKILIEKGSHLEIVDEYMYAPMNYAVRKPDDKMTKLLIQSGASVNGIYRPPLCDAVSNNQFHNVKALLDAGASVNKVNREENTPLHVLLESRAEDSKEFLESVKMLLDAGANVNRKNSVGWSPMYQSVVYSMFHTMNLLLQYGGNVNARNNTDGATILLTLTRKGHFPGVTSLLECGANPDLENKFGSTPLWASVFTLNGDIRFIKLFLKYNCQLDISSMENNLLMPKQTPLQLAVELNFLDVGKVLAYAGCKVNQQWLRSMDKTGTCNALQKWLQTWSSQPRSLQDICRIYLRKQLGLSLHNKLLTLHLPSKIVEFVEFEDILQ